MKHRNPFAVIVFSIITLGIYGIVWYVKTKNEMNRLGATIPSAWLLIIPFVSIYWAWKYSKGVEQVTGGKISGILAFVLLYLLSIIGVAIIQDVFNGLPAAAAAGNQVPGPAPPPGVIPTQAQPISPAAAPAQAIQPQPDNNFGGPPVTVTPAQPVVSPETPAGPPVQPPTVQPPNPPQVQ